MNYSPPFVRRTATLGLTSFLALGLASPEYAVC